MDQTMHGRVPCTAPCALRRPHTAALALRERVRRWSGCAKGSVTVGGGVRDDMGLSCMWYVRCWSRVCPLTQGGALAAERRGCAGFATRVLTPTAAHGAGGNYAVAVRGAVGQGKGGRKGRRLHGDARPPAICGEAS